MLGAINNVLQPIIKPWKVKELRKKLLYTVFILFVFRIGSWIPVPFLNRSLVKSFMQTGEAGLISFFNTLSGGALGQGTLFALSISPYITASIVIQLLTVAIPALERLAKSGADGQRSIQKINRYTTVVLAVVQGFVFYTMFARAGSAVQVYNNVFANVVVATTIVLSFAVGSMIVLWLSERIDEKGIGNGVSLILFTGIVSSAPGAASTLWQYFWQGNQYYVYVPLVVILFIFMIAFIVLMNAGERRIPIQYAKITRGTKMYGGQKSYLPIKVSMSGVLPVIFASTFLAIPATIKSFVDPSETTAFGQFLGWFNYDKPLYAILYFFFIIGFNYFYIAIQYNPIEMANNIKSNHGAIPGIKPGKSTEEYIQKRIWRVTLVGALMLAVIAIVPIFLSGLMGMNISLGGTSIIILVGVALDTVRTLESQMMMRHHKGFLE